MQILHLDYSPIDSEVVRCRLTKNWPDCNIITVSRTDTYLAHLKQGSFDLILSDYAFPDFAGLNALRLAKRYQSESPFIFCSGSIGEELAIEAIRAGATDYLFKQNLNQ